MGLIAITFALDIIISSLCIWLASKFSFVSIGLKEVVLIVFAVSLVSMIPSIGWLLGIILFVYLLKKASGCSVLDSVWVVMFTKLFSFAIFMAVSSI